MSGPRVFRLREEGDEIRLEEPSEFDADRWIAVESFEDADGARGWVEESEAVALGERRAFEAFLAERNGIRPPSGVFVLRLPPARPRRWPSRLGAWLRSMLAPIGDGALRSCWGPEDLEYVYRQRHAEAVKLSTERGREREANPLHDHLLRELVRGVAQATIEYVAEQDYDGPAEMFAERRQLAEEVVRFTMDCAAEEPDVVLARVRRAMR